jgi:hypothetical protein
MATIIVAGEVKTATVEWKDAKGNVARVDGEPVWTSGNDAVVSVVTGPSGVVVTGMGLGDAQISVTADADLGAGVRSLVATADVTVVAGEAVIGSITLT